MSKNSNNYSDDWQPYNGSYDKFEYDIKTKQGRTHYNCYPNAGFFTTDPGNNKIDASDVIEIRFSKHPRGWLNLGYTNRPIYD